MTDAVWTRFYDLHSGGGAKEKWGQILIEAPIEEAKVIFYNRFGHSPDRVSCTCCGSDYSVYEDKPEAASEGTLLIPASDIKPDERIGTVPRQGYVWQD